MCCDDDDNNNTITTTIPLISHLLAAGPPVVVRPAVGAHAGPGAALQGVGLQEAAGAVQPHWTADTQHSMMSPDPLQHPSSS